MTQLRQIYIVIFVYIGLNLLRKTIFFGNTPAIWYTYIPEPDSVQLIIESIEMAQSDRDLIK